MKLEVDMKKYSNTILASYNINKKESSVISNLYNLVEAIEDELEPGEEALVPSIVSRLLESGRVKLICKGRNCGNFIN